MRLFSHGRRSDVLRLSCDRLQNDASGVADFAEPASSYVKLHKDATAHLKVVTEREAAE